MVAARHTVRGYVSKGFEAVQDAFVENFSRRNELGAACCMYRQGEKVVDLWGGLRNKATGEPWDSAIEAQVRHQKPDRQKQQIQPARLGMVVVMQAVLQPARQRP